MGREEVCPDGHAGRRCVLMGREEVCPDGQRGGVS